MLEIKLIPFKNRRTLYLIWTSSICRPALNCRLSLETHLQCKRKCCNMNGSEKMGNWVNTCRGYLGAHVGTKGSERIVLECPPYGNDVKTKLGYRSKKSVWLIYVLCPWIMITASISSSFSCNLCATAESSCRAFLPCSLFLALISR